MQLSNSAEIEEKLLKSIKDDKRDTKGRLLLVMNLFYMVQKVLGKCSFDSMRHGSRVETKRYRENVDID